MAKFTCPFCYREYNKKEIQYVCKNTGKHKDDVVDGGNYFFSADRSVWGTVRCKCGEMVTTRVCPKCHKELPIEVLDLPNFPFSIVGVSNSGKTNYITVMLHELENSSGLNLALSLVTKETQNHQRKNENRIYDEHKTAEPTAPNEEIKAQIYSIGNLQEQRGGKVPTYTFTIYDGAGENYENKLEASSIEFNYINASKAILLTIDPLLLPNIRRGGIVDPNVMNNSLGQNQTDYVRKKAEDLLNGVANYIKTAKRIAVTKKLDIPVAVVLTKFDTILNHPAFGPQALIKNPSLTVGEDGRVNFGEIQKVDGEIRYWLEQIGESGFINILESQFKEYRFFGVSSFGAPPKSQGRLPDEIRPHRVLDPILWLFKRFKFIS